LFVSDQNALPMEMEAATFRRRTSLRTRLEFPLGLASRNIILQSGAKTQDRTMAPDIINDTTSIKF
jgi:hypothetical protein